MSEHWSSPAIVAWCQLLLNSHARWLGEELIARSGNPEEESRELYASPLLVASHPFADDPVFNYGNRTAQMLLELDFEALVRMPSRLTTEPDLRPERAQVLAETKAHGFFRGYSGVRVSSRGRRMWIEDATLWNIVGEDGVAIGQAVSCPRWRML